MPSGKRENFRLQLILDRQQRKLLDRVIDACNIAMHHSVRQAMQRLETMKLVTPLDDFEQTIREFVKDNQPPLFDETIKEIAKNAMEVYSSMVAGSEQNKRRNRNMMCVVPIQEVIFSTSSRVVKVPYLGAVQFRRNKFAVSSEGGIHVPQNAHKMVLSYFSNEPCLVLMAAQAPKPQSQMIGEQKLVKVTASEIDRRRKDAKKDGSQSPEPK